MRKPREAIAWVGLFVPALVLSEGGGFDILDYVNPLIGTVNGGEH